MTNSSSSDKARLVKAIYQRDLPTALEAARRLAAEPDASADFIAMVRGLQNLGILGDRPLTFHDGKITVSEQTFAIVRTRTFKEGFFAVINDGEVMNETSLIVPEELVGKAKKLEINMPVGETVEVEGGYKAIGFDMVLPFNMVGFMSFIAASLADQGISIIPLGAYSTDHILVKQSDLDKAILVLKEIGFALN